MRIADERQAASDFLFELWRTGAVADALPADLVPASRAEAYAVQALIEKRSARPLFGWKIAATSKAGQAHIGIDGPIAGRLLAERVFADGARLTFGGNRMRVAEAEFAFRFARDLPRAPRPIASTKSSPLSRACTRHRDPRLAIRRFRPSPAHSS